MSYEVTVSSFAPVRRAFVALGVVLIVAAAFAPPGCRRSAPSDKGESATVVQPITTAAQFESEVLSAPGLKVVDFYAVWCQPCKILAPILEDIAGEYKGRVEFYKVDAEKVRELSQRYKIEGYPTVLLFDADRPVHRWFGLKRRSEYEQTLDEHLAKPSTRPAEQAPATTQEEPGE